MFEYTQLIKLVTATVSTEGLEKKVKAGAREIAR